jgi:hypothetical protein
MIIVYFMHHDDDGVDDGGPKLKIYTVFCTWSSQGATPFKEKEKKIAFWILETFFLVGM